MQTSRDSIFFLGHFYALVMLSVDYQKKVPLDQTEYAKSPANQNADIQTAL
jgi:hypothetical protein